ncbi:MAG: DNA methyltransferase, partial [Raineya sp.]|nr:DNA methyltransferase [Raineya sp.]
MLTIDDLNVDDKNTYINKVICGDSIEVMKKIPKNFIHLIITSPPYNVGIPYDNYHDLLPYKEYLDFLENAWRACYEVLVPGGRICINV